MFSIHGRSLPFSTPDIYGNIATMKGKIAKKKGGRVGLLVETSHEFGRELLRGIRRYDQEAGAHWGFFLMPGGMSQEIEGIKSWECDGMIARLYSSSHLKLNRVVEESGCPLIMVDPDLDLLRQSEGRLTNPVVTTHTDAIVGMAYRHLFDCGCRCFAYVHSKKRTVWSERRDTVFAELVRSSGYRCEVYRGGGEKQTFEEDIARLGDWLSRLPRGTGVFAAMDERGQNVLEACTEFRIRVPEDILVIGVDNDPLLCDLCEPTMSSVAMDVERAGYGTARLLHRLMRGYRPRKSITIRVEPTHVSRRESTAYFFHENPVVAAAKRYMLSHYGNSALQMNDIAEHCGVSRRLVESHFARRVGYTPLRFLTGIRMERAVSLLMERNRPVSEIAQLCGFSSANYFTKAFRHHYGVSPLRYVERKNEIL